MAYFIVNGVKLGEHDSIDEMRIVLIGMIGQSGVEFDQLIHGFVADQSLA